MASDRREREKHQPSSSVCCENWGGWEGYGIESRLILSEQGGTSLKYMDPFDASYFMIIGL